MKIKLKSLIIILIVILLSLISFVGIYSKKSGTYKNILPEYVKGSNLTGKRITNLKPSEDTERKITDKEGNEVSEIPEDANQDDYTTVQEPINKEENLTEQNYKKVKEIIQKKLNYLNVSDYTIKMNNENGNIILELPENNETDKIISFIPASGTFKIIDTDSKEVLMDNSQVESSKVVYSTTDTGIQVYLDIKFTKEGKEKLKEISNTYTKIENSESESETQNTITIMVSDEQLLKTYFEKEIIEGELQLSVGSPTKDQNEIYEIANETKVYTMMINSGILPISYEQTSSEYVEESITNQEQQYILYALIAIVVLNLIYLIIKYKLNGVYSVIAYIGAIAMFLMIIRYTGTVITLNSLVSALVLIVLTSYINIIVLNEIKESKSRDEIIKSIKNGYLKIFDVVLIALVISVVFTFAGIQAINSIGMMLFYGIISVIISHMFNVLLLTSNSEN